MVKFYESIPDNLRDWALAQQVFFTASAPLTGKHVNVSPKGLPSTTFTIFDPNHAAYIDATGSGIETVSHVYENGRVTIMFCSFDSSPRIMRFFCKGSVVEWDQPEFGVLLKRMGKRRVDGARAIILLDVFKVQTSCGYGVPFLASEQVSMDAADKEVSEKAVLKDRETMGHWASKRIESHELRKYQAQCNADSLDGLTGLKVAMRDRGERVWVKDLRLWASRIMLQWEALVIGVLLGVVLGRLPLLQSAYSSSA